MNLEANTETNSDEPPKEKYHYTQRAEYRDLNSRQAYGMNDDEAHTLLCDIRWGGEDIVPCPACGLIDKHYKRKTRRQWRCVKCQRCFSVTSGTPFAYRKLPLHKLVPVMYEFASGQKGVSANACAPALGVTVRTAHHNFSKLREAMMLCQDKSSLAGIVQVDGGYFCGKPRKANKRAKGAPPRIQSRLRGRKLALDPTKKMADLEPWNQVKREKQRVVVVLRELHPPGSGQKGAKRTITEIVTAETAKFIVPMLDRYIRPDSIVQTDGGIAYQKMDHRKFEHQPVVHSECFSTEDGWNNNQAESFFSRMRRSEFGVNHGMRHQYLAFYAADYAWREDTRRKTRSERFRDLIKKAMQCGRSAAFCGYKKRKRLTAEHLFEPASAKRE
jgi:transposase-like protein